MVRSLLGLLLGVSILGCGTSATRAGGVGAGSDAGSTLGSGGGADGGGTFLTEEQRKDAIAGPLNAAFGASTVQEHNARLLAGLRASPFIEAADVSEVGNVWGRFIDGTLYLDFTYRRFVIPPAPTLRAGALPVADLGGFPSSVNLPTGAKAVVANTLPSWWPDISADLATWLEGAGYSTMPRPFMDLRTLKSLSQVSVFYWQTHSGRGELRDLDLDANGKPQPDPDKPDGGLLFKKLFGIMTSEVPANPLPPEIEGWRTAGKLVLTADSTVQGGTAPGQWEFRYGVTEGWIQSEMTAAFAPNSVVVLDSCTSAKVASSFRSVGAGAFVGWSKPTAQQSTQPMKLLFDRLLGKNEVAPVSTPRERPFDLWQVQDWMQQQSLDVDPSPPDRGGAGAKLAFSQFKEAGLLRPTIRNVLFEGGSTAEPYLKFFIEGEFGDDPGGRGKVTWGGNLQQIVRWTKDYVVIRIPTPPYPTGSIQVWVDQRASEPVPITEWDLPMTAVLTGPDTLKATMTMRLVLRADVRGFRRGPTLALDSSVPMTTYTLLDSAGRIVAEGVRRDNTGKVVETWSGDTQLTPLDVAAVNPPSQNFVSGGGGFYPATSKLQFGVPAAGNYTVTTSAGSRTVSLQPGLPLIGKLLSVDWSTRTILGDSASVSSGPAGPLTLSWPTTAPRANAPVDSDPR